MAFAFANLVGDVELRPGSVVFELVECDLGTLVTHVAIVAPPGAGHRDRTWIVLDWPYSVSAAFEDDIRAGLGRPLETSGETVAIGWVDPSDMSGQLDPRLVYDTARSLLVDAITNFAGGLADDLYQVYPARCRPYRIGGDPDMEVAFRGSCAGFVEECFESASFDIVEDDENRLPGWDLEELSKIAPYILDNVHSPPGSRLLEVYFRRKGVPPPYRIFMPGYQMSAMAVDEYPLLPDSNRAAFAGGV